MDRDVFTLLLSPWYLGLLGLCVGSFLNVVIYRLPVMMRRQWLDDCQHQLSATDELRDVLMLPADQAQAVAAGVLPVRQALEAQPKLGLVTPRSRCPHCGHPLRWHENLPVLGWLRLGGKCASCKAAISFRYPFIELLTGLLFLGIGWQVGPQWASVLYCGFAAALVALAGIDWDTTYLPDSITQPLLWAGLVAAGLGMLPVTLSASLTGAAVGYLSLWSIYWVFKLVTGKEGMGYGDFKLLAALGAWLGWQMILPIALLASLIGACIGLYLKLSGGLREGRYVPFGPFLAGGGLAVLLIGPRTVAVWLGLPG
ncbi:A24 family peptidase [Roseateles sp. SL47]|uniref:prepilin peptidase n=1 Tax=Roseateles sp. SL47 TaxID=2995138 RepID=UPI00226E6663|nr:A24 family peptidase [Roseateles sp. SL47]WAC75991.1 A24 family peptidase [Roseateles sp. SL47]